YVCHMSLLRTAPSLPASFSTAPATTRIHTPSLHDALPISCPNPACPTDVAKRIGGLPASFCLAPRAACGARYLHTNPRHFNSLRSEEHTSELQSRENLVCRHLLEKIKYT